MSSRFRPLKQLYFRWGRALGLDGWRVADALRRHGMIELNEERTHYRETEELRRIPPGEFEDRVLDALALYKANEGLED